VVVVVFQSAFHSEKYANNIFLFFKNYFWDQHIKMIWKHQKHITSKQKKKNSNFLKSAFQQQCQTPSKTKDRGKTIIFLFIYSRDFLVKATLRVF
jgi:hypothetical protein